MSLKGIYVNKSTGEKLEITDANDANGQLKGFMNVPQNGGSLKVSVEVSGELSVSGAGRGAAGGVPVMRSSYTLARNPPVGALFPGARSAPYPAASWR